MPPRGRRPSRQGPGRTTWNSTRSSQDRCPAYRGLPIAAARLTRDETAVTGRTGGHHPAGRRTGWTPVGWTAASGQGSQIAGPWTGWTPDGWTSGPWTAGRVGWTPSSGHSLAMDSSQPSWHPNHGDEDPTAGCCPKAPPGTRRASRSASRTAPQEKILPGAGHRRARQVSVTLRRPVCASAHCCRVLELESTRRGQWDYGKARCAGSGW